MLKIAAWQHINMLVLNILLYVLRLILNVSYSIEAGLVNLIFLYRLSLNRIDRRQSTRYPF